MTLELIPSYKKTHFENRENKSHEKVQQWDPLKQLRKYDYRK